MALTIAITWAAPADGSLQLVPAAWTDASQQADGSWLVTDFAADGSVSGPRPATDAEVALAVQVAAAE